MYEPASPSTQGLILSHFTNELLFFFYRQAEDSELLRYDVMDAIGDCCRLMGAARCLEHYVKSLEKEIDGFIHSEPIIQVS